MIRTRWQMLLALALPLALATPAWSLALDREGPGPAGPIHITNLAQICPNFTVTKVHKGPGVGDRAYLIEGACTLPDALLPPFSITARASFKWYGQWGDAGESIEVIGPAPLGGTILGTVKHCDKDPFVSPGVFNCTGEKGWGYSGTQLIFFWPEIPLLSGTVPANLVGSATQALALQPGPTLVLVSIVSPTPNQAFGPSNIFELKFAAQPHAGPKKIGGVKLEWERFDSRSGWGTHPGLRRAGDPGPPTTVEHYTMTQVVSIKDKFPNPGKYRVRASAVPNLAAWTPWREFSIYHPIGVRPEPIKKP